MQKTKWDYSPQPPEKNGKSKTIPDQSKTIREIMIMHSRGIMDISTKMPQYHTDEELETLQGIDVRKLDLTEIHDEFDRLGHSLESAAEKVKAAKEQKRQEEETALKEAEKQRIIEEYKNSLNQPSPTK